MIKKFYGYYHSPIGIVEIICSEDALLSAMFVDEEKATNETNFILEETVMQLDEYFKGIRKTFDLKISLEGTVFQKKVWKELLTIHYGEILSYKELAIKIGNRKAVRAVGNANGKNNISIVVPCHRVIGTNGSLTGYAGGLERKNWLLEHEKKYK
ncbi:methylated-DNA-[protein]-cysteine S-methyltransferase [Anaerosolibacter carboniphilus]|uniref:Methylated-DNA--protein-cysteine methyltransferase n=1 Tax=Anaerosolibacter carboniphilus TaxID=1417629 RepID=A0A841KW69_9FIRM|nr:methylated-DNA--[protein]-cysteine S-methyltransferase [Anaerosolibacter carboniphilus]MBB6217884.1 methylated-DNA-[protein]-cysteine S-methyltransferase [Anaerosolibacter carboniphilus]